jgi:hypothetical protein
MPTYRRLAIERNALAREILVASGTREKMILSSSPETIKENNGTQPTNAPMPPKLLDAIGVTVLASYRADRIMASLERRLAAALDSATLRAGLEWERSEPGRMINRLELDASKPELQAIRKEFIERFIKKGGAADDVRGRECAQKAVLDNSVETVLPWLEAMLAAGILAASPQQPADLDADELLGSPPTMAPTAAMQCVAEPDQHVQERRWLNLCCSHQRLRREQLQRPVARDLQRTIRKETRIKTGARRLPQ